MKGTDRAEERPAPQDSTDLVAVKEIGSAIKAASTGGHPVGSPLMLHQFRPEWGLQAYMRMNGISYHVVNSRYPTYASTGELPQIQHGKALVGWRKAIRYLKKLPGKDADQWLEDEERADVEAFTAMIQGPLFNALLYSRWMDEKHYNKTTRKGMRSTMLAPLRWIVPDTLRKRYITFLTQSGFDNYLTVRHEVVACYKALEVKLGDKPYLFGDKPSSVDALLYGHLAAAQHELLSQWLSKFPNLKSLHARIKAKYFADASSGIGYLSTYRVNVFEEMESAVEAKLRTMGAKKMAAEEAAAQDKRDKWWRNAVITTGLCMVGFSLFASRAQRSGK